MIWRYLVRPVLFRLPAETAHHASMTLFHAVMFPPLSTATGWWTAAREPSLRSRLWNLEFENPVGLAAGFDKRAVWFNSLRRLGFSHVEVGTITAEAQAGNPRPRLLRLPRDEALVNRMGFNNEGADATARRLERGRIRCLIGINLGKTKTVDLENATRDYLRGFRALFPFASYFTINVSSPNTPGLRDLQSRQPLIELISALRECNKELAAERRIEPRPVLLKIAPDLDERQLESIADVARETGIDGLIATNTTTSREGLESPRSLIERAGEGGLSGRPLTSVSREVVSQLYQMTGGEIPIVGVGGIMNGEDAWQMILAGASLLHVYTGFVYGGPMFVKQVNRHIARRLREAGMERIDAAIGSIHR